MNKKVYIAPEFEMDCIALLTPLLGLSSPDTGIHDGGEGDDGDDPTAKKHDDHWGDLW